MAPEGKSLLVPWLLIGLVLLASTQTSRAQRTASCKNAVKKCDKSRNYFPTKISFKFAKTQIKDLKYSKTFVDFTVQVGGKGAKFQYRLVKCGCDPGKPSGRQVIFTNPKAIYINDGSILGLLEGLLPSLTPLKYVFSAGSIYSPKILSRVKQRKTVELGKSGSVNFKTIENDAELGVSIISAFAADSFKQAKTGKPYLVLPTVSELTPLGRCELIKILGLVLEEAQDANKKFDNIAKSYEGIKDAAAKAVRRPSMFFNSPFGTTWFQPSEDQFTTEFARDANADYRFEDAGGSTTISQSFGDISRNFGSARYLVNAGFFPTSSSTTLKDFVNEKVDSGGALSFKKLVQQLDAVRCGNVWSNQRRVRKDNFASDYFESAVYRPDLLLADYARLLHPELKIKGKFVYLYSYGSASEKIVGSKCPYRTLTGSPPKGKSFIDRYFVVSKLNRFQAEDRVESKVLPELEGISKLAKASFEVFFTNAQTNKDVSFTVRVSISKGDAKLAGGSRKILPALKSGLGSSVKEISANEYRRRLDARRKIQSS